MLKVGVKYRARVGAELCSSSNCKSICFPPILQSCSIHCDPAMKATLWVLQFSRSPVLFIKNTCSHVFKVLLGVAGPGPVSTYQVVRFVRFVRFVRLFD